MTEQAKFGVKVGESHESDPLVGTSSQSTSWSVKYARNSRRNLYVVLGIVVALIVVAIVVVGVAVGVTTANRQFSLADSVTSENLMSHLKEFQEIADRNENSRAVMYGYNESGEVVIKALKEAGYKDITKQEFKIATYEDNGNHTLAATGEDNGQENTINFELGTDFSVFRYSGATDGIIFNNLQVLNGCAESDFDSGFVALINYDLENCPLFQVAQNAKNAGVTALLIARTEDDPNADSPPNARIFNQTADDFEVVDLPILGLSYSARELFGVLEGTLNISLSVNMEVDFHNTFNVLCYTDGGRADATIVIGSHLDSVPAGPGINDNGSGSGANLEIALQIIRNGLTPENKVLFAFWGAEEWGLLGSYHFVKNLPEADREDIALNLNFDMIGSPNFIRGIYNGSGAENEKVVDASTVIQELFVDRFDSVDLAYKLVPFNGRSDYGPFIAEGVDIPAGGLFTGAEELKSEEDAMKFGGIAGAPLDPCYHKLCDDLENVNEGVYKEMAQAAAYVLDELMMQKELREYLKYDDFEFFDDDELV